MGLVVGLKGMLPELADIALVDVSNIVLGCLIYSLNTRKRRLLFQLLDKVSLQIAHMVLNRRISLGLARWRRENNATVLEPMLYRLWMLAYPTSCSRSSTTPRMVV